MLKFSLVTEVYPRCQRFLSEKSSHIFRGFNRQIARKALSLARQFLAQPHCQGPDVYTHIFGFKTGSCVAYMSSYKNNERIQTFTS